jgi:GTPase SAR1 family protein
LLTAWPGWLAGSMLASSDEDGTTIIWNVADGRILGRVRRDGWIADFTGVGAATNASFRCGDCIQVVPLELRTPLHDHQSVRFRSTKIVLIGESDQGKTCLAIRLTADRYEEPGTTHGMQIWTLPPDRIGQPPADERREIFIWDFGGQPEYQLIHQVFLHDTTLALFLFDPTRGESAFADMEMWSRRLKAQLLGRRAVKLLIHSKLDQSPDSVVDPGRLEKLKSEYGFDGYFAVSAKHPDWGSRP